MSTGLNERFITLRKEYIEQRFQNLNREQRRAALKTDGPLLILAGAGSGKTTVVVNRIRCLLEFGNAYESGELCRDATEADVAELEDAVKAKRPAEGLSDMLRAGHIKPWNILAITFTNKAAGELKTRIGALTDADAGEVFASTFHSACVRFLRRDAPKLGFPSSFAIYDSDDSQRVMKEIFKALSVDDRMFDVKKTLSRIGRLKDEMTSPEEFAKTAGDYSEQTVSRLYTEYQKRLKAAGAFDFDDLIYNTVRLLADDRQTREHYNERFRYIMVDEYQDTSYAQYLLARLLAGERGNICVVGDDDQSIYRFRGATIENILGFEKTFKNAMTVRLEQNYRSTSSILDAANSVIANNASRKGKTLWTDNAAGDRVITFLAESERDEANFIAEEIEKNVDAGGQYRQNAVLYRMNAQSNAIEQQLARYGIPYRVVGGYRFYERAEIKDILAYMSVVSNPSDNLRLRRIINRPARKLGDAAVNAVAEIADGLGVPMTQVIRDAADYPALSRCASALAEFGALYERLCDSFANESMYDFTKRCITDTGYERYLEAMGDEGISKLENVNELLSNVSNFASETGEEDVAEFLESVALIADIDNYSQDDDTAVLMTLHSAKGLEFDNVFIAGMEEGIFPSEMSRYSRDDVEEERRLAYVGITRARKKIYLTRAAVRMLFGSTRRYDASRFLGEITPELIEERRSPALSVNRFGASHGFGTGGMGGGYAARGNYAPGRPAGNKGPAPGTVELASRAMAAGVPAAMSAQSFQKGDVVEHKKFGRGTVMDAKTVGADTLLEIDFDSLGVKKTMANYAPLVNLSAKEKKN